jgi:hypothetical protein
LIDLIPATVQKTEGDIFADIVNWIRGNVPGQECFGGSHAPGCPDAPKVAAELPTSAVIGGLGYSGTPEFLAQKAAVSSISTPYNPQLKIIAMPTGVTKIGLSSSQRSEAAALVSQPGYNVSNAMVGSPAWIVAHGG